MSPKLAGDLLYDSEATLRLVDSALASIDAHRAAPGADDPSLLQIAGPIGLLGLSQVLARGYAEIVSVLGSLRESRSLLERTTVARLQHTHAKLREVSHATESAATSILDGLERSLALVDRLDAAGVEDEAKPVRESLRDELFTLIGCMQFQDITTQQINYASSVLTDMETRLGQLASILDPASFGLREAIQASMVSDSPTFDPAASTENAEQRQAVADEVFRK